MVPDQRRHGGDAGGKDALDEWDIRDAPFWFDLKIAVSTALFALSGER